MSKEYSRKILSSDEDEDQTQDTKPQKCEHVGFVDSENVHLHACRRKTCSTKNFEAISGTLCSVETQTETESDSSTIKIKQKLVGNIDELDIPKTNAAGWQWPKLIKYPEVKKEAPEATRAVDPLRIVNQMGFKFHWATLERQRCRSPCVHTANVSSVPLESVKIYIGNLSPLVKKEDIGQIFGHFGKIRTVDFPSDRHPIKPQGRGFAFVHYVCPSDCARAVKHMSGCKFGDTFIVVSPLRKKPSQDRHSRYAPRSPRAHRSNRDDSRRQRFRSSHRSSSRNRRERSRSPMRRRGVSPSSHHSSSRNRRERSRSPMRRRGVSPSSMSVRQSRHRAAYSPITPPKRSRRTNPVTTGGPSSTHLPVMGPNPQNPQPLLVPKLENTDNAAMYPQSPGTATPQNLQPLSAPLKSVLWRPPGPVYSPITSENLPVMGLGEPNPQNLQPVLAPSTSVLWRPPGPVYSPITSANLPVMGLDIKNRSDNESLVSPSSSDLRTPPRPVYSPITPSNPSPRTNPVTTDSPSSAHLPVTGLGEPNPQNQQPLLVPMLENTDNAVMYPQSVHRASVESFMNHCNNAINKEAIADYLDASKILRVTGKRLQELFPHSSISGNANQDTQ